MNPFFPNSLGQRGLMNNLTKPYLAVKIEDRIARCLTQEILRGNLTASFRLTPASPEDVAAQAQERALLMTEVAERVTHLLDTQKKPIYRFDSIQIRTINNTIGMTPVVKTRLEITVTVTRR